MTDEKYTAQQLEEMADALLAEDKPEKDAKPEKTAKDAKPADKAEKAVNEQLDIVKNGGFTDFEFSSSVKSITDSLKTYNDSQASLDAWYSLKAYNKELYSPEDIAEKLSFVTRKDVIKAANGVKLHTVYKLLPEVKK